jgi:uncharacterized OsmC-like protein
MATEEATKLNGWDLEQFKNTIAAVEENPEAGKVTWRGHVAWDGHFGLDAHADEIEQLGQVIKRRFTLRGDHPPELLGENTGLSAVETLLAALGSCIAGTYAAHATARGVKLDELEVEIESTTDLNGFLQLAPTRAGLQGVKATLRVKADADDSTLDEIRRVVTQASPVYDSVANPVAIESSVERVR